MSIRIRYPDKVPIIITFEKKKDDILLKHKFLVPNNYTLGQFMIVLRKRMLLLPDKAIFLFINHNLPATSSILSELYECHKDSDGMLRITCAFENTFGYNRFQSGW